MNSRMLSGAAILALALASQSALAHHGDHDGRYDRDDGYDRGGDYDYARVIDVTPLMERVRYDVPVEHCWTEEEGYSRRPSADQVGARIMGGAVGAMLGHTVGRGDGRRAATVGGAVVGALIGNELARNHARDAYREPRYEQVQRCRTDREERFDERVSGYQVTYLYNGRRAVTRLPYDPGRYLRVAVDVHPLR
jgi:uncharacterized protein YcfJ